MHCLIVVADRINDHSNYLSLKGDQILIDGYTAKMAIHLQMKCDVHICEDYMWHKTTWWCLLGLESSAQNDSTYLCELGRSTRLCFLPIFPVRQSLPVWKTLCHHDMLFFTIAFHQQKGNKNALPVSLEVSETHK